MPFPRRRVRVGGQVLSPDQQIVPPHPRFLDLFPYESRIGAGWQGKCRPCLQVVVMEAVVEAEQSCVLLDSSSWHSVRAGKLRDSPRPELLSEAKPVMFDSTNRSEEDRLDASVGLRIAPRAVGANPDVTVHKT